MSRTKMFSEEEKLLKRRANRKKWRKENRAEHLLQRKRYREKYREKLNRLNLIRVHTLRYIKPWLILKYGGYQLCKEKSNLETHHIKYTTNIEDILLLCKGCHYKMHHKGGQYGRRR